VPVSSLIPTRRMPYNKPDREEKYNLKCPMTTEARSHSARLEHAIKSIVPVCMQGH
jgi:hypothetical protein